MKQAHILKIVVASPGDVQAERDMIPAIVDELNKGIADERGLRLEVYRWETDAYPGFHPLGPQGQIDSCLRIEDCDLLIGIFWKRFGTPVLDAQSGTEHEIRLALESFRNNGRPQLMIYFNQEPYSPKSKEEIEQWGSVLEFRANFPKEGLWWEYNGKADFEKLVRNHLTQFIRHQPNPEALIARSLDDLIKTYRDHLFHRISNVRIFGEADTRPLEKVFVELNIIEEYQRPSVVVQWLGLIDAELRKQRDIFARDIEDRKVYKSKALIKSSTTLPGDEPQEESNDKVKRTLKPDELLRWRTQTLILGAPGCGKTTLLRYLAWKTFQEGKHFLIFLELKSINETAFEAAKGNLADLLFDTAIAGFLNLSSTEYESFKSFFLDRLRAGEVAIFFDGLDEVAGAKFFNSLCRAIDEFVRSTYRNNNLIISTRPYALQTRFDGLKEMEIASLSPRQIEEFLKHYYGDNPIVKQLLQQLRRRHELRELMRVPFLLGVIAYLYRQQGELIGERLELYRQIVQLLVTQLDREKLIERFRLLDPDGSLKREFLKQLAYDRLFVDEVDKDTERLILTGEIILDKARGFCQTHELENPYLLAADVKATPLLREIGADTYAFAHLTLHEYLAAVVLAQQKNCESIFCRAYFNPTLVEMEVLPMVLGLVHKPNHLYTALEQLPESLVFTNLRLRARGLAYTHKIDQQYLAKLAVRMIEFITNRFDEESPYLNAILRDFSKISGHSLESITEKIVLLLKDENEQKHRKTTILALQKIGGELAVEALLASLNDDDLFMKAAKALHKIGDAKAAERFQTMKVKKRSVNQREDEARPLVHAIGEIGGEHAMNGLLALLKDGDSSVRDSVIEALGKIGGESVINGLLTALQDKNPVVRKSATQVLGKIGGERAVESLINLFQAEEKGVAWEVAKALANIGGDQILKALLIILKENKKLRECAIWALGKIGEERAVEGLFAALKDDDKFVRRSAARALGGIGSERALNNLLAALKDESDLVRLSAIEALGEIGKDDAVDGLDTFLYKQDDDRSVRCAAARAIGKIGGKQGVETLLVALKDKDKFVRLSATQALGELGDRRAVDSLLVALTDEGISIRRHTAKALGKIGDARTVEALIAALEDEDSELCMNVIEALGKIGDQRAVQGLLMVLDHEHWPIRREVVAALGKIGGKSAIDGLLKALTDQNGNVRKFAAEALVKIGYKRVIGALILALKDENKDVRQYAAEALGKVGDKFAVSELLIALKDNDNSVRSNSAKALEMIGDKTLADGLAHALSYKNDFVRQKAAQVVGYYTADKQVLATLQQMATNDPAEEVRTVAREAAEKYANKLRYFAS